MTTGLYREKYTKEQFLEKLKKASSNYNGSDYGFELTLKEDLEYSNDDPYYYEITDDDHFNDFKFKLDLTLSYDNEDYLEYQYDGGSILLDSEYACFCLLSHEYRGYISRLRRKIEDRDAQLIKFENALNLANALSVRVQESRIKYHNALENIAGMIKSGKFNGADAMELINKALSVESKEDEAKYLICASFIKGYHHNSAIFYGSEEKGYTSSLERAGRYTLDKAKQICAEQPRLVYFTLDELKNHKETHAVGISGLIDKKLKENNPVVV